MKFTALPLEQNAVTCRTAVIDFLVLLLYEKPAPETVHPVYYTRSQAAIAKQTKSLITPDLVAQHTGVKYNFYGLCGQSIPQGVCLHASSIPQKKERIVRGVEAAHKANELRIKGRK